LGEDRGYATEFLDNKGNVYTPDFTEIAKGFGCWSKRISKSSEIKGALKEAFEQNGPSVIEIIVNRDPKFSGSPAHGWWDVPIPVYLKERRAKYEKEIKEEDLS
jgi:thiamine pyrophosphate-dependent acetolactate synthase large subunit-like protein